MYNNKTVVKVFFLKKAIKLASFYVALNGYVQQ